MSSIGTRLNTFNDASGRITVSVFSHRGSPPQNHWRKEEILVGAGDMIAIGGGGVAAEQPHGALLTASYPNEDLTGWIVESKDHQVANPHELVTYVVGLRIAGMSRQQLLDAVHVVRSDSGTSPHPEAEAGVPDQGFLLVGGGFFVDWHGAGNLATASFPATEFTWKARSKDHNIPDPANLQVYAICLRRDLPVGTVTSIIVRSDSGQTNHPAASATLPPGFALTGGGGEVRSAPDAPGNLLWKLEPATSQDPRFTAASKDHVIPSPAPITAYALGIRL